MSDPNEPSQPLDRSDASDAPSAHETRDDRSSDATGPGLLEFLADSLLTPFVLVDAWGVVDTVSAAAVADLRPGPVQITGRPSEAVLGLGVDALDRIGRTRTGPVLTHPASGSMRLRVFPLRDARPEGGWLVEIDLRVGRESEDRAGDQVTDRSVQLDTLLVELTERYEELNRFSGLVSHDLQAPTRQLLSFVEMLRAQLTSPTPEIDVCLDAIEAGAAHLLRTTSELLAYSQNSWQPVSLTDVDAHQALEHVIDQLAHELGDVGGRVTISGRVPPVRASKSLLSIVFQHLVENAISYRHPDRPLLITVTSSSDADRTRIDFTDNGIGIPADAWSEIFEPFRRLHPKDADHTGIGLATVRRILERFAAKIVVSASEPGVGTTFTIEAEPSGAD